MMKPVDGDARPKVPAKAAAAIRDYVEAAKAAPKHRPLSQVFDELFADATAPITVATIRDALSDRSFGALLLLFGAINCLPLPPGSSAILGIPLLILSAQMIMGYQKPWIPARVLRAEVPAHVQLRFNRMAGSWLKWFEKFVKPRYWPFNPRSADIAIGSLILLMSVILWLPIPLGNWMPAVAIFLLSFALIERDGIVLSIGIGAVAASLAILATVLTVGTAVAKAAVGWMF